ncbi:MAG: nucleoside triphosphatase [Ruminococcaceae bacterium]|nr:nucleoside triphosphatase [Oscillospiraceae bacterium]
MSDYRNIPPTMQAESKFCMMRREKVKGVEKRVPYNPCTGHKAASSRPYTFATFDEAMAVADEYDGVSVGIFEKAPAGMLGAVDIDDCRSPDTGELSEMAQDIITIMRSPTEISPSGEGIRIWFTAPGFAYDRARYYINNQKLKLEIYVAGATNKCVSITGDVLPGHGGDVEPRNDELLAVLEKYMLRPQALCPQEKPAAPDEAVELLPDDEVARLLAKDRDFSALWGGDDSGYPSRSEADLAMCNKLAFYCRRSSVQIDRIIRRWPLFRQEKWESKREGSTYGGITILKAIDQCTATYNPQQYRRAKAGTRLAAMKPDTAERYGWHDIGNGNLFADFCADVWRYVPERKKGFVYDGKRWQPDMDNVKAHSLCKKLAHLLMNYAMGLPEDKHKLDYMKFVQNWQRRAYRETIIRDATTENTATIDDFDKDPMLFNCINGTLNLDTGEFHEHRPADMLSKLAGVKYDPAARCERWESFIDEVMDGDADKARFMQKALGYALTGDTSRECFFILFGPKSRNGKSTLMETYMRLMGDYGKAARPDTIAQRATANGSGPSEDIARLAGARFVNVGEPDKKLVLSAAMVKTLTGNDCITARFLHENSFEFYPHFKIFIHSNYLPAVTDITVFTSGRVKIIPFERRFEEGERDEGLKTRFAQPENMSGILNWCIEGLRLLREEGFTPPDSVQMATEEYRRASDKIGRFMDEEMVADPAGETKTVVAYERYSLWCRLNGHVGIESQENFKVAVSNITPVKRKRPNDHKNGRNPTWLILGYKLKDDGSANFGRGRPHRTA